MLMPAKDDTPKEVGFLKENKNLACYKELQARKYSFSLRELEITAHYACRNALN